MTLKLEKKFQESAIEATNERIKGYASVFNIEDQQGDQVAQGAFATSLMKRAAGDVKMLWQHDPAKPIGVWQTIREDDYGLYVEGEILTEVEAGREALALLRSGAVNGLSIGYRTLASGKTNARGRILKTIDLWEISLVTFPMLVEARAELAGDSMLLQSMREFREASKALKESVSEER